MWAGPMQRSMQEDSSSSSIISSDDSQSEHRHVKELKMGLVVVGEEEENRVMRHGLGELLRVFGVTLRCGPSKEMTLS